MPPISGATPLLEVVVLTVVRHGVELLTDCEGNKEAAVELMSAPPLTRYGCGTLIVETVLLFILLIQDGLEDFCGLTETRFIYCRGGSE